jgi:LysM repeat protein
VLSKEQNALKQAELALPGGRSVAAETFLLHPFLWLSITKFQSLTGTHAADKIADCGISIRRRSVFPAAPASRIFIALCASAACAACALPEPPPNSLPTLPAVLDITPAPTLDIDQTATAFANLLRPSPTPAGLYIVAVGDTLTGIAERFGTTVDELIAANGLTDPNAIQPGQTLIIPSLIAPIAVTPPSATEPVLTATPTLATP